MAGNSLSPVTLKNKLVANMSQPPSQLTLNAADEGDVAARKTLTDQGVNRQYTDPNAVNNAALGMLTQILLSAFPVGKRAAPNGPDTLALPGAWHPSARVINEQRALPGAPSQAQVAGPAPTTALPPTPPNASPNLPANLDTSMRARMSVQDQTMYPYANPQAFSYSSNPYSSGSFGDSARGLGYVRMSQNPNIKPRVTPAAKKSLIDLLMDAKGGPGQN